MCLYWKKIYLCGCTSHLFRDRCHHALTHGDVCDDVDTQDSPRHSHFKCYDCLIIEDRAEKQQAVDAAQKAEEQRKKDVEKARQATIRKEAEERAEREREEDRKRERDKKAEVERAKREGPKWVETTGSKRGKKAKGHGAAVKDGGLFAQMPASAPPTMTAFPKGVFAALTTAAANDGIERSSLTGKENGENGAASANGASAGQEKEKANGIDPGGRAGRWGPKSPPKKILKPENPSWKKS